MQNWHAKAVFVLLLLIPKFSYTQGLGQLMAAMEYHQMQSGPEKMDKIRKLELKGWYHKDELMDHMGNFIETKKVDLAPLIDSLGEPVFLVTDISPEFPGGAGALSDYLRNSTGNLLSAPHEEVQNTLFIKFTVLKDGSIDSVEPANPFPDWIPVSTTQKCMNAVRDMPKWLPGIFKDQPVKAKMLMIFSLRR